MSHGSYIIPRLSHAYFVFRKGKRPGVGRQQSYDEADAVRQRMQEESPEATFIIAREVDRSRSVDPSRTGGEK